MYCQNLDQFLEVLVKDGAVKLPSIYEATWRERVYSDCLNEIGSKSYGENLEANLDFLNESSILTDLLPKLAKLALDHLNIDVKRSDIYNVCRLVRPGDTSEGYRGHFDSHLFTLVTPINIPHFGNIENGGQLHFYPYARKHPKSEIRNIYDKVRFKQYNSPTGFEKLASISQRQINDFQDYRPLLFMGNTTFHGNAPVESKSTENRMTILTHFFDPSPKYGIGKIMRTLRRR